MPSGYPRNMYKTGVIAGAFPLIHPGYIQLLRECKGVCSYLIVFLQDDPSAERPHKSPPFFSLKERQDILESLRFVDEVIPYATEGDLERLLREVSPDVRFLGTEYKSLSFTGEDLSTPIHWINRDHGWSTTLLLGKIRGSL